MAVRTIEEGTALFSVGLLRLDDIPALALLFLNGGCEVEEMAALAAPLPVEHPADLRADFARALRLAGHELPSRLSAAETLRRIYAERGASDEVPPAAAAQAILEVFDVVREELGDGRRLAGDAFGIEKLIALYYSYDEVDIEDEWAMLKIDQDLVRELKRLAEGLTVEKHPAR